MQSLNDFIVLLLHSLVIVVEHIYQVASLKVTAHPVFLGLVYQDSVALENPTFEFTYIQITVFEQLLPKPIQHRIQKISSFKNFELKLVLMTKCLRIVASVTASKNDG